MLQNKNGKEDSMKTLIRAEGRLTPSCSKTHISYSFTLTAEAERLHIDFSYRPKILEDDSKARKLVEDCFQEFGGETAEDERNKWHLYLPVNNFLSLSIDDPEGFRGCVHRQTHRQTLYLMHNIASPGLLPGRIGPGQWRVTISVHAVVTDLCRYSLHVRKGDRDHENLDSL